MPASKLSAVSLSLEELKTWIREQRKFVLIDTSIPEEFEAEHIPGAQNACVFDVTFMDRVRAVTEPSPTGSGSNRLPVVVYGTSARSLASATAAEKLTAAGFDAVCDYRGGLKEWREAGEPTEGTHVRPPVPAVQDRVYAVDPGESRVKWTGRSLTSEHSGTLNVSRGEIAIQDGSVSRGEITLDMTSIQNTDIEDSSMQALLTNHLKSDDFFDVIHFPEARLLITSAETLPDAPESSPNYRIHGELTLKGETREIDFPAQIGLSTEGAIIARADFDIDRTHWNVIYGSGKFYEKLGKHLVSDLISLDIKIAAR